MEQSEIISVMQYSDGMRIKYTDEYGDEWTGYVDVYESDYDNQDDERTGHSICLQRDDGSNLIVYDDEIIEIAVLSGDPIQVRFNGSGDLQRLINDKVYTVISIEAGNYRISDETGETNLYEPTNFDLICDGTIHRLDVLDAVLRIIDMESLYDKLFKTFMDSPDKIRSDNSILKAVEELSDYLSNGEWLQDHDLDEQKLLLSTLKRGVLSEDGLYNLLCDIRNWWNDNCGGELNVAET